jgi:uroporphyrinogen III methyltransferase/synthase
MTAAAKKLAGTRVLITRSEDDCAEWAEELERRGARPVLLPCIRSEPIDTPELRAALARALADADWLVLTSRRGVEACARLLSPHEAARRGAATAAQAAGRTATVALPARTRVATVGAATADEAREQLGRADLVAGGNAAALGTALTSDARFARGAHVVLALAANAGDTLERALAAAGARCARFDVYRTIPAPPAASKRALSSLGAERVVLASPSAASGFVHQVELDVPVAIYTIGPSTTAAARALGLDVTAEAREPSLEGILEAMQ